MIVVDRGSEEPKCVITGQEPGGEATGEGGKPKLQTQRKELDRNSVQRSACSSLIDTCNLDR